MVKSLIILAHGGKIKYHRNLPWYFNPRKRRVKITKVNYCGMFIALAHGSQNSNLYLNVVNFLQCQR
jgi:hypothetical protein